MPRNVLKQYLDKESDTHPDYLLHEAPATLKLLNLMQEILEMH